jgi:phospholipid/cholesterol/gamma-HCH transport system substrate-binding protein
MTVKGNLKLPSDTQATIVSDGLLGSKYVNLIPGHAKDTIVSGGKITKTQDFQSLEDLVGQIIFLATNNSSSDDTQNGAPAPAAPAATPPAQGAAPASPMPIPKDAPQ